MNYLAHAYLSFGNRDILVGNMISDFVKGKKKFDYPVAIQKGIALHRTIDRFTDDHPATKQANQFFKPAVGLYAGAFTDVAYDHFLASDQTYWSETPLHAFAANVYELLYEQHDLLPERFQQMLPYMRSQDWLLNYRTRWGTEQSFGGVVRRAAYLNNSAAAFSAFEDNYEALRRLAGMFLPDVKKFASSEFELLLQH